MTNERVCLLVLGMHRSGTSALTRVISLLGADLPTTLLSGSASNAKGHWESEPIIKLNDEIFKSGGISWRSPEAMPEQWYRSVRFDQFKDRAQALMESEFGLSPLLVLKDPRICKLVPFWLSVLEQAGIKPAIVSIVRSPEEVADSLMKRDGLDRHLGMLTWLRYVLRAERDSRTKTRVHLSYDGLLADWQSSAQSISDTFDLQWPSLSTERAKQINGFLSDTERHHRKALDLNLRNDASSWATEVSKILINWVTNKETASDHATLDAIAKRFDEAIEPMLAPILVSYEKSASVQKLQALRAKQTNDLVQLNAKFETLDQQIVALAADIDAPLPATDPAFSTDNGQQTHTFGSLAIAVKALRARQGQADAELELKNAELAAKDQQLSKLALEVNKLDFQHEQAKKESASLSDRVRDLTAERDAKNDEVISTNAELAAKERETLELGARFRLEVADLASRERWATDLLHRERERLVGVEKQLSQLQRVNAMLLIIRGRFEAASEDLARLAAKYNEVQSRLRQADQKIDLAQKLIKSHESTIIDLRADRLVKIDQREKLQAAVAAIRDNRTQQIQQRDRRIRELALSVKRLEKKNASLRALQRGHEAASQALAPPAPARPLGTVKLLLRRLIPASDRYRLRKTIELVKNSDLFDARYYQDRYKDLEGTPDELVEHYVKHGGPEGRTPSAAFDSRKYLQRYPDVAQAGLDPLVHFLKYGNAEGRTPFTVGDLQKAAESDVGETTQVATAPIMDEDTSADAFGRTQSEVSSESARDNQEIPNCSLHVAESGCAAPAPIAVGACLPPVATFSALATDASDWLKSLEISDIGALRAGQVAIAIDNASAGVDAKAALRWFEALNDARSVKGVDCAVAAVRSTFNGDRLRIEDAWLSSDYTLRIRLAVSSGNSLVVRCCQKAENDGVVLCSEQVLIAGQSNILDLRLASRFAAVLLVVTDRQGNLIDSTLLPFPTLLRGGVQHGELIACSNSAAGWSAHEAYVSDLLTALATNKKKFAVAEVSVCLGDANGTELIFSQSFRRWLYRQFNVRVKTRAAANGKNPGLHVLEDQIRRDNVINDNLGRASGRTLLIGANSIPTLSILLAKEADLVKANALRTIVVDELSRQPLRAVDHPIIDRGEENLLRQDFDPPIEPRLNGSVSVPVSISFSTAEIRDVRASFAVAGDIFSAIPGLIPVEHNAISVIVRCNGDVVGLTRLLESLSRQQSLSAMECLLIGNVPDVPNAQLLPVGADRLLSLVKIQTGGGSIAARLRATAEAATHERILLVDDKKILHDPRTLAVLAALCAREEFGTAGCQIVKETSKKNGVVQYETLAAYVPVTKDCRPVAVARPNAGKLQISPLYPVLANPLGFAMIKRDLLSSVVRDWDDVEISDSQLAILLGQGVISEGKLNIATSMISVSDLDKTPILEVDVAMPTATPARFVALEEF